MKMFGGSDRDFVKGIENIPADTRTIRIMVLVLTTIFLVCGGISFLYAMSIAINRDEQTRHNFRLGLTTGMCLILALVFSGVFFALPLAHRLRRNQNDRQRRMLIALFHRLDELGKLNEEGNLRPRV